MIRGAAGDDRGRRVLLVDVGNSRVKWRLTGGDCTEGSCPVDALAQGVPLAWGALPTPEWVLVSLVAGERSRDELRRWCAERWSVVPRFVDSTTAVPGMQNRYANPAQLGVDRWLAMIAVRRLGHCAAVVVDCGTAITMDLLDRDGVFHGGMILPGRRMLETVLRHRVPYLDEASEPSPRFPADNTANAIALGIHTALVASLSRFVDNSAALLGEMPMIHVTGGDGRWFQSLSERSATLHENLVLDGLQVLMELDS